VNQDLKSINEKLKIETINREDIMAMESTQRPIGKVVSVW
jgi:hypothetical protein